MGGGDGAFNETVSAPDQKDEAQDDSG